MTIEKMQRARELDGLIIDYRLLLQAAESETLSNLKLAVSYLSECVEGENDGQELIKYLLKQIKDFATQRADELQKEFNEL
jgi:hypothetical protein